MKQILLSILRNKTTTMAQFRQTAHKLGFILAHEVATDLETKKISIETPLASTDGCTFVNNIILVPILRSGLALLEPFMNFFPMARVGFVGLQRDETTAIASLYYEKMPPITPDNDVVLLDPMIATGGSAIDALKILCDRGIREEKIRFAAVVAAPEGLERIKTEFPKIKIFIPTIDEKLNDKKFIIPGLGDFGDRYFGTD